MAGARIAVLVTVIAWCAYFGSWLNTEFIEGGANTTRGKVEALMYLLTVSLLTASALAYLVTRLGHLYRLSQHRPATRPTLDEFFDHSMPTLTVIIPSYREERRVIRNTLLSAALQEYPYIRLVLLIDDPPAATTRSQAALLEGARQLPADIEALLAEPAFYFEGALARFEHQSGEVEKSGILALAADYRRAVGVLHDIERDFEVVDHSDRFFLDHIVLALAADLGDVADGLEAAAAGDVEVPRERLHQLQRRLAWLFRAQVTSFERKQYASLSHEPNKAMNLNSYLGLMGGTFTRLETSDGTVLSPCPIGHGDLHVPDPDYVLTLDADSIILPEYCLRLVHLLEQNEFQRVAVAQTPYSAYPGANSRLERMAGATTDLQHLVHQGMTHYDATFWVGANAILRKRALDEVCETSYVGDFEIRRYIQDRTVIEDTESTIDLGRHGWRLYNYPDRLAYSSTPPDFGALCIQRRRWANGGLLILGKYRRQLRERKARGERARFGEIFLRANYMASIFWTSVALLIVLAYPFSGRLVSPLLGLIALPYFVAMASDLKATGYRRLDVLRIYGLNMILVCINLAGVGNSIVQAITGEKSVFGRTPKVRDRTVANLLFVVAPYLVLALGVYTLQHDIRTDRLVNAGYAALDSVLTAYAIVAFIGIRNSIGDAFLQLRSRLYKPAKAPIPLPEREPVRLEAGAVPTRALAQLGLVAPPASGRRAAPMADQRAGNEGKPEHDAGRDDAGEVFELCVAHRTVFQPIVSLASQSIVGWEALARFEDGLSPDVWLEKAAKHGTARELERELARAAVSAARQLPADAWLSLNGGELAGDIGELAELAAQARRRLLLEIVAEPGETGDLADLKTHLPHGTSLALVCTEPSYETLRMIDLTRPSFVKLSRHWVDGLSGDRARSALGRSFVELAAETDCVVIAEGIERRVELEALRDLGVHFGQGFLLGRPRDVSLGWSGVPAHAVS